METQHEDPVRELAERVARVEPLLSELTRQRLLAGIHARIDAEEQRARARRYGSMAVALASAACLALGLWLWPAERVAEGPAREPDATVVRALPAAPPPASAAPAIIPYVVSSRDAARAVALLDRAQTHVVIAAGERVLASLGTRARLALIGPAELRVVSADAARVELELLRGTLLGDYDHAQGGLLSVRAADAVSEIVGTVFLVQTAQVAARTAVLHGTVQVQVAGRPLVTLRDLQTLSSSDGSVASLNARDAQLLRTHADSLRPAQEHGILSITAPNLQAELDGRALAETPLWLAVAPGTHLVTLRGPGRRVRTLEIQVRAGERSELAPPPVPEPAARAPRANERVEALDAGTRNASDFYRAAESAMRNGEHAQARALLAELVEMQPSASERDLALYELAELSLRATDYVATQKWLEQLERVGPRPALAESAHFLRCRLLRARKDSAGWAQCMTQLRALFPASSHK